MPLCVAGAIADPGCPSTPDRGCDLAAPTGRLTRRWQSLIRCFPHTEAPSAAPPTRSSQRRPVRVIYLGFEPATVTNGPPPGPADATWPGAATSATPERLPRCDRRGAQRPAGWRSTNVLRSGSSAGRFDQRDPVSASATVSNRRPATYMNVCPALANTVTHLPGPALPQVSSSVESTVVAEQVGGGEDVADRARAVVGRVLIGEVTAGVPVGQPGDLVAGVDDRLDLGRCPRRRDGQPVRGQRGLVGVRTHPALGELGADLRVRQRPRQRHVLGPAGDADVGARTGRRRRPCLRGVPATG